ncbi:uncharacterized protein LOC108594138 [Callithrix jacchus]
MEGTARERDAAAETAAPLCAPRASGGRRGSNNLTTSSSGAAPRARPLRRRHGHAQRHDVTRPNGWFEVGVRTGSGWGPGKAGHQLTYACERPIFPLARSVSSVS